LNEDERAAFAKCASDWSREHSPEAAGRMCACFFRGLRMASGLKVIDGGLLKPWPSRSLVAGTAFGTCIKTFAAQTRARCEAEEKAKGRSPPYCLCGSGGCEEDFEERIALRLGYMRHDKELQNLQDAPQHEWGQRAAGRFLEDCSTRGRSRGVCGCLLKFARIQFEEEAFKTEEAEMIYSPSNAWRPYIEGCELFHDGPSVGR
jgi:hypothetical protein